MKRLFLVLFSFVFAAHALAEIPYNSWWQKANTFYSGGNYDSAAHYYELLAAGQPSDAAVYYNLANTYYRLNQVGPAVLNYERALELRPGYKDAQDNLELAQSRISNRIQPIADIFFVQWWKGITGPSMAQTWSIVSLVLFLAGLSTIFLRRWGRGRGIPVQVPIIVFCVFACTLFFAYVASERRTANRRAVVMQQDSPLKENPRDINTLSLIPEGTVVVITVDQTEWLQVKLPDGRTGWMHHNALERI